MDPCYYTGSDLSALGLGRVGCNMFGREREYFHMHSDGLAWERCVDRSLMAQQATSPWLFASIYES